MDQSQLAEAKLTDKVNELLGRGQRYASQLSSQATAQLRERPAIAVAGALAIGFLVGALLARRSGR